MTALPTTDEKIESVYAYLQKCEKKDRRERWVIKGVIIGLVASAVMFVAVLL